VAISLGAVGPTPVRAAAGEARLAGEPLTTERLAEAERLVRAAASPFDDTRGSAEYKRHLVGVLFRRAFDAAHARARGSAVGGQPVAQSPKPKA
jgi:carbon-monoxide dehydrogenase medium subunit